MIAGIAELCLIFVIMLTITRTVPLAHNGGEVARV
jgi:hypothetical protein